MNSKIWLSSPHMSGAEEKYVKEAFDTNWIAPLGPNVDNFEKALSAYLGDLNVTALSSGTAAIHIGLILLGVKPGDEVICQDLTFSASANPIVYLGATPVFIDSEPDSWNMSPVYLEEAIKDRISKGHKPKAIIPVHLYGMPSRIHEILAIAARYDIPVLEDAAEALGSSVNGRKCGTFGQISVLSFNGNKIITTSGGGALVSADRKLVEQASFLSSQARDPAPHYQHSQIGYNYRMSNLCAGVGRGQMEVLDQRVAQRRRVYALYVQRFSGKKGLTFVKEPAGNYCNRWLTTVLIDPAVAGFSREDLRLAFEADNIEARPLWKPMHLQPIFQSYPFYGNGVAEKLFDQGLCLPSGSNLTDAELERIFQVADSHIR